MSTEIDQILDFNNSELTALRYCGDSTHSDRIMLQIKIFNPWMEENAKFIFNRELWKEFRDKVDQAFNDYPYTKP